LPEENTLVKESDHYHQNGICKLCKVSILYQFPQTGALHSGRSDVFLIVVYSCISIGFGMIHEWLIITEIVLPSKASLFWAAPHHRLCSPWCELSQRTLSETGWKRDKTTWSVQHTRELNWIETIFTREGL
jgi:hypothetical protein